MGKPGTKAARFLEFESVTVENGDRLLKSFGEGMRIGDSPESAYRATVPLGHRKRFGQFFTPMPIARLMGEWIQAVHPTTILDPAAGPGVFARVALELCPDASITCVDVDPLALGANRAAVGDNPNVNFARGDFLLSPDESLFDAAIANPPYLRHHDLNYAFDIFQVVGRKNHVRLSKLSNIYVLFILEICRRLRVGGRAAVIVPGEWVNANFGDQLKLWLISRGLLHTLLYFSHASAQFEDALTTASILFLEKPDDNAGRPSIRTIFVHDGCPLDEIHRALDGQAVESQNVVLQEFDPDLLLREKKWNHVLSHGHTQTVPGLVRLAELARTRRGIATGCNEFFHLTPTTARNLGLRPENLTPCIGRAMDVAGTIFDKNDFNRLIQRDGRAYLFDAKSELNESERRYIEKGEADKLNDRFLCAARENWYEMEQRPPSAIWAAVFGRTGLRFIHNSAGISNLTTFHCIYPHTDDSVFSAALTACLNSRVVQDRARRQRRVYGGGLLKFEPKDLLDVEVPDVRKVSEETLKRLACLLNSLDGKTRHGGEISAQNDELDAAVEQAINEAVDQARSNVDSRSPSIRS